MTTTGRIATESGREYLIYRAEARVGNHSDVGRWHFIPAPADPATADELLGRLRLGTALAFSRDYETPSDARRGAERYDARRAGHDWVIACDEPHFFGEGPQYAAFASGTDEPCATCHLASARFFRTRAEAEAEVPRYVGGDMNVHLAPPEWAEDIRVAPMAGA